MKSLSPLIRHFFHRALGAVATLALLWLLITLLLMLAVPWWLPTKGATLASAALGREVRVESARYQPWRSGLVLEGLSVAGAPEAPPLLRLKRLEVSLSLRALLAGDLVIQHLTLQQPELRLARLAAGRYDIDDLLARGSQSSGTTEESSGGLAIHRLEIHGGQLLFDDRPLARQHRLEDLQLVLPFMSTLAEDAAQKVEPHLSGRFDGVEFDSRAEGTPFAADRSGRLALKLAGLDLAPFAAYVPADLPWRLRKGRLDLDLALDFMAPSGRDSKLKLTGLVNLDDLAVATADGRARLGWQHLALPLVDVQPLARRVALGRVSLKAPYMEGDWPAGAAQSSPAAARAPASVPTSAADAGPAAIATSGVAKGGGDGSLAAAKAPKTSTSKAGSSAGSKAADKAWQLQLAGLDVSQGRLDSAGLRLEEAQLRVGAVAWPLREQAQADLSLKVQQAPLTAQVQVSPARLTALLDLRQLELDRVANWLPLPPRTRLDGRLSSRAKVDLGSPLDEGAAERLHLALEDFGVESASLQFPDARKPALAWRTFKLDHAALDVGGRQLELGLVALDGLRLAAARDAQGRLDWSALQATGSGASSGGSASGGASKEAGKGAGKGVEPHPRGAASQPSRPAETAAAAPWRLSLKGLNLQGATLGWQDEHATNPVAVELGSVTLSAGPLRWPQGDRWPLKIQARMGTATRAGSKEASEEPGSSSGKAASSGRAIPKTLAGESFLPPGGLAFDGQLTVGGQGLSGAQGQLRTRRLPLHLLGAYLDPDFGLHLAKAELNLKVGFDAQSGPKGWSVQSSGDAGLGSLALMQLRQMDGHPVIGEDLLSWQSLKLSGLSLKAAPGAIPRLDVRELVLDDAYARLIVDPQGRFNLRDLGSGKAQDASGQVALPKSAAPTPAALPAVSPSGSAPGESRPPSATQPLPDTALPIRVAIAQTRINHGLVDFNDRFIRPNYSARLSELQGSLGAFDTAEPAMAPLSLRGRVMGNGQLEVTGELRPGRPLALDIQAQASDIELVPLSPYAGKYAGYAIENGRLSTKLRYRIEADGQLNASNQIILNQLTFGDKVESPDATSLPVRFAVSLLKDSRGVIDVNLPISGSINDPEFSIGGLVWRMILNLIGKALTAPFALFGGGQDSGPPQISFEPGGNQPVQTAALQRLGEQLKDRPAVRLTVEGWADAATDTGGLKEQQLDAALRASAGKAPEAALRELYRSTSGPDKPKNLLGLEKSLPPAQMRAWLLAHRPLDSESLRQLALARAVAVRDLLAAQGVPAERLRLAPPRLRECGVSCEESWQPHVQLSLDTP